jgi:hypothetical protein
MGLFDFLIGLITGGSPIQCPSCGAQGARKTRKGLVICKNPACSYFGRVGKLRQAGTTVPTTGDFRPGNPIAIRYRNFAEQDRTFTTELSSVVRKKNHLVARVAPTGRKITLNRDRIQNLAEVEAAMPPSVAPGQNWPTRIERQILLYHKRHGTTSSRYQQVRAKYPNW